ncbi:MAG: VOC family protein [Halobacteriales archaeon]|nr:VOC family protein [Halobacteriales archaeon]
MTDARGELPAESHVGRVALRVGSIDRVRPFYEDVVGLPAEHDGDRLVVGPTPDEPLVILEEAPDAPERPREAAGLFHLAVRAPDRAALGDAVDRLRDAGESLTGASDHLVSEALYLRDPEGNGVELYRDRPRAEWPEPEDGLVGMETLALDLEDLAAAGDGDHADRLPAGTDMGHVHLEVSDLGRAEAFYADALGLGIRDRYGASATFLAAGEYHHHVGINAWNGRSAPAGDHRGLAWWELAVPDAGALEAAVERLEAAGHDVEARSDGVALRDPDGMALRLVGRRRRRDRVTFRSVLWTPFAT